MTANKVLYQVDSFTGSPFFGNPAGVCILDKRPSVKWMQNIAMEMNLSETAFVFPGKRGRNIRFYTPESEIDLCGHATLATGHIFYETGLVSMSEPVTFYSKAGLIAVSYSNKWIVMNFPSYPATPIPVPDNIETIIGIEPRELHISSHGWALALLKSEADLKKMKPDFNAMKNSEFGDLIATSKSDDAKFDFCVRCFAPALGINEDPVTGSAHCTLAPFWHGITGKTEFLSHQVSKRGGILKVSLKNERVEISGRARTIFKADLLV
jgi:PhzF family phenazine biosynthesis protein